MNFISKELDEYCNKFTTNPSKELDRLEHLTHTRILNPRMISSIIFIFSMFFEEFFFSIRSKVHA